MFDKISMKRFVIAIGLIVLVLVATVGGLGQLSINGVARDAERMGLGKDLVADVLPSPLFLVEAQLTAHEAARAPQSQVAARVDDLERLRAEYEARNQYWAARELPDHVKSGLLGEQRTQGEAYWTEMESVFVPALKRGDADQVEASLGRLEALFRAHRAGASNTATVASAFARDALTGLNDDTARMGWILSAVGFGGMGVIAALMILLLGQLRQRLGGEPAQALEAAHRISQGDLTFALDARAPGVIGALEAMRQSLRDITGVIANNATSVGTIAPELRDRANAARNSVAQQMESTSEIAAAAEELSASVTCVSENAAEARKLADVAGVAAHEGVEMIRSTVDHMRTVASTISDSVETVRVLGEQSGEISRIVQVIREIADQTNLLALNAAIEAARAGEQGRGFAVVADEVRKLAERTAQSTEEISATVDRIQRGTGQVTSSIEGAASAADTTASEGQSAAAAMARIESSVSGVVAAIQEIAEAVAEQTQTARLVAGGVERIAQSTQGAVQRSQRNADEAGALVRVSEALRETVARFQS